MGSDTIRSIQAVTVGVSMGLFTTFLRGALEEGRLLLRAPWPEEAEPAAAVLLAQAYQPHARTVAGPPVAFDAVVALAAGRALYQATWWLLNANAPVEPAALAMPGPPRSPSHHLSADLLFRYLPALHRRARALRPDDELSDLLANLLRSWPLSGVLADVADQPLTPPEFEGHRGLQLLYAERLAKNEKPAWFPEGTGFEIVELVWQELGRDVRLLSIGRPIAEMLGEDRAHWE